MIEEQIKEVFGPGVVQFSSPENKDFVVFQGIPVIVRDDMPKDSVLVVGKDDANTILMSGIGK